jgi:hypothetical protein
VSPWRAEARLVAMAIVRAATYSMLMGPANDLGRASTGGPSLSSAAGLHVPYEGGTEEGEGERLPPSPVG